MKFHYQLPIVTLVTALSLNTAIAAPASATGFDKTQTQQIETIVHDYLLNNPQVLVEVSQKLQAQQEQQFKKIEENAQKAIPEIAAELFNAATSPVAGNAKGDVTLVEFFDYQCPHCKDASPIINDAIKNDPNLRVVYKEFPIFGQSSTYASKAALAANKQGKYLAFHEALIETQNPLTKEKVMAAAKKVGLSIEQWEKDMDSQAVKDELAANLKLAQKLGIMGTPAFVVGSTQNAASKDSKSFFIPGGITGEVVQSLGVEVRGGAKTN